MEVGTDGRGRLVPGGRSYRGDADCGVGLWTGRTWNLAPASATGHNGTAGEGPFMIEMVGDFDAGQDPFDGEQRTAAIETVAHLVRAFGLQDADVKFHDQPTNRALGTPR